MLRSILFVLCWTASVAAMAGGSGIHVRNAWVRATVPTQKTTVAFMDIRSDVLDAAIISVTSPVAGSVEIHTMSMHDDVMEMHAVPRLDLPAGKWVKLAPMGMGRSSRHGDDYHLMLLNLKHALKPSENIPLLFKIEEREKGKVKRIRLRTVKASVRDMTAP